MLENIKLEPLLEALLLAAGKPLREEDLLAIFSEEERPSKEILRQALKDLQESYESRGIRLVEIASGYQFQIQTEWAPWVARLWEEKAPRYSRALLETLALIAYRQPITRGEIEEIRGVSISQSIFKTLLEDRDWIRVVGHKEVPGKPALYATTKLFLDYFGLKTLEELPSLPDVMNLENRLAIEDDNIEKLMQNALTHKSQGDLFQADSDSSIQEALASAIEADIESETAYDLEAESTEAISASAQKLEDETKDETENDTEYEAFEEDQYEEENEFEEDTNDNEDEDKMETQLEDELESSELEATDVK